MFHKELCLCVKITASGLDDILVILKVSNALGSVQVE